MPNYHGFFLKRARTNDKKCFEIYNGICADLKKDVCKFKECKQNSSGKVYHVYYLKYVISILTLCSWCKKHLKRIFLLVLPLYSLLIRFYFLFENITE